MAGVANAAIYCKLKVADQSQHLDLLIDDPADIFVLILVLLFQRRLGADLSVFSMFEYFKSILAFTTEFRIFCTIGFWLRIAEIK